LLLDDEAHPERLVLIAVSEKSRVLYTVFAEVAGDVVRIITARKATTRETGGLSVQEAARFERDLATLETHEDGLFDLLTSGVLDEADYKRQRERVRERRADLTRKQGDAHERLDEVWLETAKTTLELAQSAKITWLSRSASERRQFLELVVSNARLDGQTVRYDLRKPFQVLSEVREDPDWRTREDSNLRPSDS
jgi:hypothetical protein